MGGGSGGTPYGTSITGMTGGRIIPGANSTPNIVSGNASYIGRTAGLSGEGQAATYDATGQVIAPISGGGGGGWGASGGSVPSVGFVSTLYDPIPINLGAAGGKAINTNGFTVTFIGGSNRVFGVIG